MKQLLAKAPLFSGLSVRELEIVEQTGQTFSVERGRFIFLEGDPADRFFLVLSGKIKIQKSSPQGKEQILLIAGPGDSFGEAALFAGTSFPASAETIESARLIGFSRGSFLTLIKRHPVVAANMIAGLSLRLHHLTRLVQQISLEDISTRLAGYLMDRLKDSSDPDAAIVRLTEKKMVLASLLGTAPETLSRAFRRLSKLGIISVNRQQITIIDRRRLAEIADGKKF